MMREGGEPMRRTRQELVAANTQLVHPGVLSVLLPVDVGIAAEANRVVTAVIVEGERTAPMAGGDRSGKAMYGAVVGAEDHASAPFGDHQSGRLLCPFFPKLQGAPVTLFPFRVQVEQHVDAPVESQPFIIVRVRMGHKHALRRTAMKSSAFIVGIWNQPGDPADRLQESEKGWRRELIENG